METLVTTMYTSAALTDLHERTHRSLEKLLDHCAGFSEEQLSRELTTWGDKRVELTPAHVLLRTQTHVFQHQGQVAAMSRLLGRPIPPGLDFPLA